MNLLTGLVLLFVGLILLVVAWDLFCISRGEAKRKKIHNQIHYTLEDLRDLGNPFSKFEGYSNL
jgi:hypothetical protein